MYNKILFILFMCFSGEVFSQIKYTNLGPQLYEGIIVSSTFYKDAKGKKFLYAVVRGKPSHLLSYDLSNNNLVTDIPIEASAGSIVFSDGILYAGGSNGHLYSHVPGSKTVNDLGKVFGTETALYDLRAAGNGLIYGGTYPGCRVFSYHPKDGFADAGKGAMVEGESYVRSMVYSKSKNKIYAGVGAHAALVELDLATGKKRNIPHPAFSKQQFVYNMALMEEIEGGDRLFITIKNSSVSLVYNITTEKFEYEGKEIYLRTIVKSPLNNQVYVAQDGDKLYSYPNIPSGDYKQELLTKISSNAIGTEFMDGILYILTITGEVVKYNPSNRNMTNTMLTIAEQPKQLIIAHKGPANTIWTSGNVSGANSSYNPETGKTEAFKGLGQTESVGLYNDKLYLGTYTKSRFYVYDSKQPWNMSKNPKFLGSVAGQDRPFGGLAIPQEGKVFFGTVPAYGQNGGVLVEFDANKNNAMSKYMDVVPNHSIITLAYKNGKLFGGTSIWGGLGSKPVDAEAKLFVWDIATKTKIHEIVPVKDAKAITCLINGNDGNIWGIAQGYLFKIDPVNYKVISSTKIYNDNRSTHLWREDHLVFNPKDNMYYGSIAQNLFKLDPKTLSLVNLDKVGNGLTLGPKNEMYFFLGADLWKMEIE